MKNLFDSIIDFFIRLWKVLFVKRYPSYLRQPERGLTPITPKGELPVLSPEQAYTPAYIHPIFIPGKTKFKPAHREYHLGRRRSKYYFNKNK